MYIADPKSVSGSKLAIFTTLDLQIIKFDIVVQPLGASIEKVNAIYF